MTIDERVKKIATDARVYDAEFKLAVRTHLIEVARDQRHACAEALTTLQAKPDVGYVDWQEAHQAVMNAEIR